MRLPYKLNMYEAVKKNWDKTKHLILFGFIITSLLLLTVVFKNTEQVPKKTDLIKNSRGVTDLNSFKEFLLDQIKSPFINLNYEIKKGDTIQKILKKYNVKNFCIVSPFFIS